jgi:hypothetical protein
MPQPRPLFCQVLAFILVLSSVALHAAEPLTPEAAKAHVGQSVTVCGKVANTYYSRFVEGKPTFINFGRPYPNHVFSIAIMGRGPRQVRQRAGGSLRGQVGLCDRPHRGL